MINIKGDINCKNYIKELENKGKVLVITINGDEYLIFRGLTLPYMFSNSIFNGNLNLLGQESGYFSNHIKSAFFKPNGLRQLLDKAKELSFASECDDCDLEIKVCDKSKVINKLDIDYIIQLLEFKIDKDLEFIDIDLDLDKSTEEEVDLAFMKINKELAEEYIQEFNDYFLYADKYKTKLIKDKINSLLSD